MNGVKVLIVAVSRNREEREALFMYIYFESGGSIIIILVQITNHQVARRCRCQVRHELISRAIEIERPSLKLDTKNLVNEINVQ